MRIRVSSISSPSPSTSSHSSHSVVSAHSFASSSNSIASSSPNSSSFSLDYQTRCEGLDLLVKAVLHVAGFVLGVPFTQRRVIRRRKRAFRFRKIAVSEAGNNVEEEDDEEEEEKMKQDLEIDVIAKPKRRKRVMAMPSKYQDSVLQPWGRGKRQRRSIEMDV